MESSVFKNYIKWYGKDDSPINNVQSIKIWALKTMSYEVVLMDDTGVALGDIGELTLGSWTAYADEVGIGHYFFELEVDVMAFKLRFL